MRAPWTHEQVVALQNWQNSDFVHPFTCPNRGDDAHRNAPAVHGVENAASVFEFLQNFDPNKGRGEGLLLPTVAGWECMVCGYKQDWAHDFMLDPTTIQRIEKDG